MESAQILGELEEERGESSKSFRMSDGSTTLASYGTDVHYQDEQGRWNPIDNSLSLEGAEKNKSGAKVLEGQRTAASEGSTLREQMEAENISSCVVYEDILPGTDLEYITSGSSLKENIIVKERQDCYRYTFQLKTNKLDLREEADGSLSFAAQDSGAVLYQIPAMYMVDADGNESDQVTFEVATKNKKHTLVITADEEWMNEEGRAFPVVIDPTLNASSTSVAAESRIVRNQYVQSGRSNTSSSNNSVGYLGYDSGTPKTYRTFVQFRKLPELPADSVILNSKFYYAVGQYTGKGMDTLTVAAHKVTATNTWSDKLTWNNQPGYDDAVLDYQVITADSVGQYVGWDVTPLLKKHYEGNGENDITAFALVGMAEGSYTSSSYATVKIIQESSNGAFENAEPLLTISYRSSRGIEDYYTYRTQDLGKAGVGYIGEYSRQLTLVNPVLSTNSTVMPFTLSLIYNSACGDQLFTDYGSAAGRTKLYTRDWSNMTPGNGWKLNIQQTIVEKTVSGKEHLIYTDEDGTEHYFLLREDGTYQDEDGLKLTIEKSVSPLKYTMTDEKRNRKIFHKGYLSSIIDVNGNAIYMLYNGAEYSDAGGWEAAGNGSDRITKIVRVNSGQTEPVTVASIGYGAGSQAAYISQITDGTGRIITLQQSEAFTNAEHTAFDGWNLKKITFADGSSANYTYYNVPNHGVNRLARSRDSETMRGGRYTYRVKNPSHSLISYSELFWSSDSASTELRKVRVSQDNVMRAWFLDFGLDCTENTADDIKTTVLFDSAGRSITQVTTDASGETMYGASSTGYSTDSSGVKANKVTSDVALGRTSNNLMPNSGAEGTSSWTTQAMVEDSAKVNMKLNGSGYIRSGNKSFHIWVSPETAPDGSNRLWADFTKPLGLEAGKTYTFSGYYKNPNSQAFQNGSRAYLQVNDPSGNRIGLSTVISSPTNEDIEDGWVRLSTTFTAPVSGSYQFAARTNQVYYRSCFDDLQVEEAPTASGFDLIGAANVNWEHWNFSDGAARTTTGILGSKGAKVVGDPTKNSSAWIEIPLNVSADNTFVLSGWAKANSVPDINKRGLSGRTFGLAARLFYTDGETETHYASFDESCTDLQFASCNVVPEEPLKTIQSVRVACVYYKNCNLAQFDNVTLRMEPVNCYSYNDKGELVSALAMEQSDISFRYRSGDLVQEVDPANGTYHYSYDDKHQLTTAENDGVELALTYDQYGHVVTSKVSNPQFTTPGKRELTSSAAYSGDGDYLVSQTDALGNTIHYTTNDRGLVENIKIGAVMNEDGTEVADFETSLDYTYNANNDRLTKAALDEHTAVNYTYGKGVIQSVVRESLLPDWGLSAQQTYTFEYDQYGNVTAVKVGSQTLVQYSYLAKNGPLTGITYSNGHQIGYTHDVFGRVVSERHNGAEKYRYVYSAGGMLERKEELDAAGTVVKAVGYEYDSLGRPIRSYVDEKLTSFLSRSLTTQQLYDSSNRLTAQSWQFRDGTGRTERYTYHNEDGTLRSIQTGSGEQVNLSYDYLKRLSQRCDGDIHIAYHYTDVGTDKTSLQVDGYTYSGLAGNFGFAYAYDRNGNITGISRDGEEVAGYTYDGQNQLLSERLPGRTITYTYDTAGNIRSARTLQGEQETVLTYTYGNDDWQDQLTAVGGHSFTYDGAGNPLTYYNGRDWTFTWANGRELSSAVSGDTTVSYTYDAGGLRLSKTSGGVTHKYTYLGGKLVRDQWGENTLDLAYDDQGRPYSLTHNGETYRYILNLQGDVIGLIDGLGSWAAEYSYDAWGKYSQRRGRPCRGEPPAVSRVCV